MKNLKIILLFIIFVISNNNYKSQQIDYNSHYIFNPYLLNPSMIGDADPSIFLGYRKQWSGFQGSPENHQLTFDSPLINKKSAIGLRLINDVTNIIGRTSGILTYKYKVKFNKKSDLSFALSGGFFQNRIIFENIVAVDQFESTIFQNNQNSSNFDGDFGLNFRFKNFIGGLATKNIFQNSTLFFNDNNEQNLNFSYIRHYSLHAQYDFISKNKNLKIRPLVLLQSTQGIPFVYEGNLLFSFKNKFHFNFNYSHEYSYGFSGSLLLDDMIQLSYTFEIPSDKLLSSYGFNTNEISIRYIIRKNSNTSSNLELDKLNNLNSNLYEKTDYIEEKLKKLESNYSNYRDSIQSLKDSLNSVILKVEKLRKNLKFDEQDLNSLIDEFEGQIDNKPLETKTVSSNTSVNTESEKNFYLVIGAFKDFNNARSFKAMFKKEYNLNSELKRDRKDLWYLLYCEKSNNIDEIRNEIPKIVELDRLKLVNKNPWIYVE